MRSGLFRRWQLKQIKINFSKFHLKPHSFTVHSAKEGGEEGEPGHFMQVAQHLDEVTDQPICIQRFHVFNIWVN